MTVMQKFITAGMDTFLGMGIVFWILMLISIVIYLFKFLPCKKEDPESESMKMSDKKANEAKAAEISVIVSAAIATFNREAVQLRGEPNLDEYIVRTIRKRGK